MYVCDYVCEYIRERENMCVCVAVELVEIGKGDTQERKELLMCDEQTEQD